MDDFISTSVIAQVQMNLQCISALTTTDFDAISLECLLGICLVTDFAWLLSSSMCWTIILQSHTWIRISCKHSKLHAYHVYTMFVGASWKLDAAYCVWWATLTLKLEFQALLSSITNRQVMEGTQKVQVWKTVVVYLKVSRDPLYPALHNHENNGEIALLARGAEETVWRSCLYYLPQTCSQTTFACGAESLVCENKRNTHWIRVEYGGAHSKKMHTLDSNSVSSSNCGSWSLSSALPSGLVSQMGRASSVNEIGLHSGASGDLISSSQSSVSGKTKYRTLVGMAPWVSTC